MIYIVQDRADLVPRVGNPHNRPADPERVQARAAATEEKYTYVDDDMRIGGD